jgi:hypothetical protein
LCYAACAGNSSSSIPKRRLVLVQTALRDGSDQELYALRRALASQLR